MRSAKRPWTNDWLRLAVLWGFAGAQPALDLLGRREAFVIDAGLNPAGLATLVGVILLGPGLLRGGCCGCPSRSRGGCGKRWCWRWSACSRR